MTNKLPCRLRAALVVAGCLVPAMALAQLDTHFHTRQRTAPQSDIEYGSRTIPLPMMQRPPSPRGRTRDTDRRHAGAPEAGPAAPGHSRTGRRTGRPGTCGTHRRPAQRRARRPQDRVGRRHRRAQAGAVRRTRRAAVAERPGGPPAAGPGGPPSPKGPVDPRQDRRPPSPKGPGGPAAGPADRRKPTGPGADQPPPSQQAGGGCEPHSPLPRAAERTGRRHRGLSAVSADRADAHGMVRDLRPRGASRPLHHQRVLQAGPEPGLGQGAVGCRAVRDFRAVSVRRSALSRSRASVRRRRRRVRPRSARRSATPAAAAR